MTFPSKSLILRICKEPSLKQSNVSSLKLGSERESVALEELGIFLSSSHKELQIEKCGLLLCEDFSLIGASPDCTFSCQCYDQRLLIEIKGPYTRTKTSSLQEALSIDPKFFLDSEGNLEQIHMYYTQVQLQLYVFKCDRCLFVTWTPNWMSVAEVAQDRKFASDMFETVKVFCIKHILPELLTTSLEQSPVNDSHLSRSNGKQFCFCQSEEDTLVDWVVCDSANCRYEWLHLSCLVLKAAPRKIPWYFPACRKEKRERLHLHHSN